MHIACTEPISRTLEPGDADRIVELHRRVYAPEFGLGATFIADVGASVESALARGWPTRGGVWLVRASDGVLDGSLALTHEGAGVGQVRWFALSSRLRGIGLGRRLLDELLCKARGDGLVKLELNTFSELAVAAGMYRGAGFRVTSEREREDWGAPIVYQHYELDLELR